MNEEQHKRADQIKDRLAMIREKIRMLEKNIEHCNDHQNVVISLSGSVAAIKVQYNPGFKDGYDFLPFSAEELLKMCLMKAEKEAQALQKEYDEL